MAPQTGRVVKHKHAICSSHFPGSISWNICFSFSVFSHHYLKPPTCDLASVTWGLKIKGNVEQAKALKLNLDSSWRKHSKHWYVSCWFSVTCNQLVFSFSCFFFLTRAYKKEKGKKKPLWNNRVMIVVGTSWNLSVMYPLPVCGAEAFRMRRKAKKCPSGTMAAFVKLPADT